MLLSHNKCCQQDIRWKLLWLDWLWFFQIHCFFTISANQSITCYRFSNAIFASLSVSYWKDKLIFWAIGGQKAQRRKKEQCEKNSSPNIPRACSLFIPTNMLGQQIKAPDQQSTSAQALTLSTCLSALLEKGPKTRMSTVNWKALQNWPHCFVCPFQLLVNTHLDLTHLTRISDLVQPISALREVPATGKTRQHLRFRLLKRTSRSSISTSLLQENPHEGPNH